MDNTPPHIPTYQRVWLFNMPLVYNGQPVDHAQNDAPVIEGINTNDGYDSDDELPGLTPVTPSLSADSAYWSNDGAHANNNGFNDMPGLEAVGTYPIPAGMRGDNEEGRTKTLLESIYELPEELLMRYTKVCGIDEEMEGRGDGSGCCTVCQEKFAVENATAEGMEGGRVRSAVALACLHVFHAECVLSYMYLHKSCPECHSVAVANDFLGSLPAETGQQGMSLTDTLRNHVTEMVNSFMNGRVPTAKDPSAGGRVAEQNVNGPSTQAILAKTTTTPPLSIPIGNNSGSGSSNAEVGSIFASLASNQFMAHSTLHVPEPSLKNLPDEETTMAKRRAHLEKFEDMLVEKELKAAMRYEKGGDADGEKEGGEGDVV